MSKRNKYRIIDWEDSRLFFIVFGLAVATLSYFNLIIAGIFLIVGMYLFYYERKLIKEKEKFITSYSTTLCKMRFIFEKIGRAHV